MKKMIALLMLLALVCGLTGCNGSEATTSPTATDGQSELEPVVLTFGQVGDGSDTDFMTKYAEPFMEMVTERTNGRITFDFYPNSQLGSETAMLDQLISGTLDFAPISSSVISTTYPDFAIYALPYAFDDVYQFFEADAAGAFDNLYQVTADQPVRFLGSYCAAYRGFANKVRPVRTASDIEGLRLRVMAGDIYADIFAALGATTNTIDFSELYTALQQNVIDGEDNVCNITVQKKFYEVEPYYTDLQMCMAVNPLLMSEKTLSKITEEEYQIILDAAKECTTAGADGYYQIQADAAEEYKSLGGNYIGRDELTDEEVQTFKDALQPVWEEYTAQISEETFAPYSAVRESMGLT